MKKKIIIDKNDSITPITVINNKIEINSPKSPKSPKGKNKNVDENLKISLLVNKSKSNKINNRHLSSQYKMSLEEKENEKNYMKDFNEHINFNLFDYYCLRKLSSKKKEIELFNKGSALYRKRMDIINVYMLLFLIEKKLLNYEQKRYKIKEREYSISPK